MNSKSQKLTRAGLICAIYIALNVIFSPISFGLVQVRISEALTVLVLFFPEGAIGLTLGCVISNLIFSTPLDACVGGVATLISSLLVVLIKSKIKRQTLCLVLGEIVIILLNAVLVPLSFFAVTSGFSGYIFGVITVLLGEILSVGVLGSVLYFSILKIKKQ